MNPKIKFGVLTLVIVASLGWLAMDGINEAATYYVTIAELEDMQEAAAKRIRVGGDVVARGRIARGPTRRRVRRAPRVPNRSNRRACKPRVKRQG